MRCNIIIIGILTLIAFSCKAQKEKTIKLKANWQKGEVKEMIVQQSGSLIMNGQENKFSEKIVAKYLIKIIDKNEKGYVVEWKILNDNKEHEEDQFIKKYTSQFKYVIKTDLVGNFKKLSNWKSLVELNKNLKNKVISEAKKENVSQTELENILAQMKLADTKSDLIEMCKGLTDIFHGSFGQELQSNNIVLKPITIPSPHFKEGIPAKLETKTKDLNNDRISVTYTYIYDYEKLRNLYKKNFPNQEYKEQKMRVYSKFLYNTKTGWFEEITFYNEFEDTTNKNITIIKYIIRQLQQLIKGIVHLADSIDLEEINQYNGKLNVELLKCLT